MKQSNKSHSSNNYTQTKLSVNNNRHILIIAIANRLNIKLDSKELLGLIGRYDDENNYSAINSWLSCKCQQSMGASVGDESYQLISRLACWLESEVQDVRYFQN